MAFLKKEKVAQFFLSEANPYSQKRAINGKHVLFVFIGLLVGVMLLGSYFDKKRENERRALEARKAAESAAKVSQTDAARATAQNRSYVDVHSFGYQGPSRAGTQGPRQFSASQIIKRGENPYDALPVGTTFRVRLIGKVESADQSSPVTAVIIDPVSSPSGGEVIPAGAKVIGQGHIDVPRERLQISFSTFVFPEGEQYSLSGLAIMSDGESGLVGSFSSGSFKRHASQFIGNFIGGMADGLKDRTSGGQFGIPMEPGSLKNGALNGVTQSSLEYAKSSSEEMGQTKASIQINDGLEFNVYLNQEFHP